MCLSPENVYSTKPAENKILLWQGSRRSGRLRRQVGMVILFSKWQTNGLSGKDKSSDLRRIESEPDTMDGLQIDLGICFEILPQFGDEYIHAPAQEIVIFAPDIQQHFLPF
jgi:hypothetical protein